MMANPSIAAPEPPLPKTTLGQAAARGSHQRVRRAFVSSRPKNETKRRRLAAASDNNNPTTTRGAPADHIDVDQVHNVDSNGDQKDDQEGSSTSAFPTRATDDDPSPVLRDIDFDSLSLSDRPLPHSEEFGILLGHRVVKTFKNDETDTADAASLFLGTVMAYKPPGPGDEAVLIWDGGGGSGGAFAGASSSSSEGGQGGGRTAIFIGTRKSTTSAKKKKTSKAAPELFGASAIALDKGLYRVVFDDGDTEDVDPTELYRCALEYHVQVRNWSIVSF